ncbi:MAG: hypothetical protein K2X87_19975 [Gemmataceae bacterium]|nr:hypothetical protein [Gemmataceae bacterium]
MPFGLRTRPFAAAVAVLSAALAAPGRAPAGLVDLHFDNVTPSGAVAGRYFGNGFNSTPGPYYFTPVGGPEAPNFASPTAVFCVELSQFIAPGTTYTYDVQPIANSGNGALFLKLWGAHYDPAWGNPLFGGSTASAAFQIASWELAYDGPSPLDVAADNFQVDDPMSPAAVLAQSWLDGLAGLPSNTFSAAFPGKQLVLLHNDSAQDLVAMVQGNPVPAPPAAALGLIGAGLLRLRLRRSGQ